ncbi:hypothetical protein FZEAL_451 [Fusarium zealandicum]|uniref:HNH nuclease domain-containing protein n=1 Tax=Fusarium zealandicum TaxID=1053134 RepID=A0A8H4XQA7_9HYPO|nr:hypothetical protein FZEAL_451 [Fusarium zealandicum]
MDPLSTLTMEELAKRQELLQVLDRCLDTDRLASLAELTTTNSRALATILADTPPQRAPIGPYITDFDERCDIVTEWEELNKHEYYTLNATALAIIMVAPIDQLRDLRNRFRSTDGSPILNAHVIFTPLCEFGPHAIRNYLSKGGRPPSNTSSPMRSGATSRPPGFPRTPTRGRTSRGRSHQRSASDTSASYRQLNTGAGIPGSPTRSESRNTGATRRCKQRDNSACILSGLLDPEGAHIFPFSMNGNQKLGTLMPVLAMFWGQAQAQRWYGLFLDRNTTESARNLLSLNHQYHFWWDKANFALKPLTTTANEITVQFHWLKTGNFKPRDHISRDSYLRLASLDGPDGMAWGDRLAHRKSGLPIETGQTFIIKAEHPDDLPSFELLQLQWDLLRVAAMCGAGEASDDDFFYERDDEDDVAGFSEVDEDVWYNQDDDSSS